MDDLLDDAADIDGMLAGPATPPAAAAPAPVAPAVSHRSFSDPKAVREAIYAKTLAGFKALQPIANARYSLSLHDVDYADPGEFTAAERKRAILEGRTLSRRLRGTWKLADATTGEPVASRKSTLANVPYYTDKGTFVLNGSDWTLAAQMRLLPGVYSRRKDNGELESHVNVMPGKGLSHRIQLDPAAGVFTVKAGGSTFPLLPILRSLGVKDEEVREAWGDLLPANAAKADPRAVRKFHDKVVRSVRPDDVRTPEDRLRETLAAMPLDPRVTRTTLGAEFSGITPAAYLAATKRLIGINRGEQDPDDRDHLAFMHVLGQEDLIAERVLKDLAPIRRALWKATMKQGDLSGLPAGVFTDALNAAIQRSGLGQVSESVNPSMWMEQMGRVSRMGVGGIPDTDAIPDECYDEETEVFTSEGWKPWRDVAETTRFGCLIGDTLEFHEADRLIKKPYAGVMYGIKTRSIDHLVTPGHRIWCQKYRGGSCLKRCGPAAWGFELAAAVHRKPRSFQSTHAAYAGVPLTHYQPPISPRARKVYTPFAIDDWAEFVGWYVAEGSVDSYALHARNKFHITISQNVDANPAKVAAIADLLSRMGIRHSYQGHNFVFVSGHIGAYLLELGIGAENKRLPTEAFDWPISARRRLLDAMVSGDGHRKPTGSMLYATTSPGLHADFVRLAVGLGYAAAENTPRLPRKKSPDRPDCKKIYVSFLLTKLPQGVSCAQRYDDSYRKIDYSGMVYCAEVPGERLLVRRHGSLPIWSGNSKSVQPSHLGYVDPIATPENSRAGVDSRFASPILKGDDGKVYTRFRNLRTGEQELVPPDKLVDATIAFPNEMRDLERRYVNAMRKGRMLQVPRDEVDYAFERMEDAFSPLANLVPMKSGIKGQRLAMGSRMSSQALPLVGAEAPLVQNLRPDVDESYEKQYGGAMGAIRADADAWVKDVTDDGIVLQDAAGKERTVELTRHEPTNRKTGYHQTAVVQPGQPVRAGELLARSNYTDAAGTTALGRNVRIAMIPGFGSHSNYEDAWVISQGAAEKFKSEHYYQHAVDEEDGQQIGRKEFLAAFPAKYSRKMLDGFTDDGVIKVGTRVEHGDPLVLAIKKRTEDRSKVYRGRGPSLIDAAETWDHHSPGVVTDVVRTKEGAKVVVRTEVPAQVADKLCVSADHEVLTSDRGWIPIAEVGFDDLVAVPGRSGETEFRYPTAIYHYAAGGRMYALETAEVSLLATAAHRLWARRPQDREFSLTRTDQAYLNHVIHATSGPEGLDRVRDADMSSKIESWVEDYAGPVYCLSVPGEVFYVRRNGKAHWTGNSNRFGGKGVIASIVPDEEMPRDEDGHVIDLLFNPAGVISRCYDEKTEFLTETGWKFGRDVRDDEKLVCYRPWNEGLYVLPQLMPMHRDSYRGDMIVVSNKLVDFCVTPGHRMWVMPAYAGAPWRETTVDKIYGGNWRVPVAGEPIAGVESPFVLPSVDLGGKPSGPLEIDAGDFAEFFGWYTAEGNTTYETGENGKRIEYKVHVSQSDTANPDKCRLIATLLNRLPFTWSYNPANTQFHIPSKQLAAYLIQFGKCDGKWLPKWLFAQPPAVRQRFLDAYWLGDGTDQHTKRNTRVVGAGSRSERLVDDLQRLHVYQGISAGKMSMKSKDPARPMWRCGRHGKRTRILEDRNWRRVPYNGMIYCPTVPTGYVVTRRNGKLLFAGNSNPAAALEIALGKIAAKTGEPYRIRDFDKIEDLTDFTQRELEKHGVSDEGSLTDPRTGRKIPGVMTGSAFFMKLHHMAADKNQGRGTGGYSEDGQPSRGGDNAAKRMALMSLNALLSHGGTETIKDALHVRGQANPEFWARFMAGHAPPIPEVPFVHRKFVQQMKASGINVTREGSRFKIHALRGKDVDSLVEGRILKNAETADYREGLKPVKGGLFDEAMTGGHGAGRWAGIALAEPMVSPVFEDPARRILGLTEQGYRDVIAGKSPFRGRTGPGAIASALESMDLKAEIAKARAEMTGNSKTRRDDAIKRLKYLKSAEKDGIHPGDWVWDKVPVLPPAFRPVSISKATGQQQVADPNVLYGELFEADKILRSMHGKVDDLGAERLAVYDALKAVVGLGDPIHPKTAARGVRGLLKEVMGDSPKYGTVQRKLLSAPVDLVGRSVIVPDPDLDLDSVGVPETHAWEVYKPFIVRRLVRRGASFSDAARAVRDRTDVARGAMLDEMETRPVILDRAPVLHRYGVLAFKPKLVKGDAIRMAPLVTSGFGADFDGDQMNYQVPSGEAAVREAYEKLLPSRNLISPANFKVHQLPSREYAAGLWLATKPRPAGSRPRTFATAEEAIKAYRRGEIDADQDVEIAR